MRTYFISRRELYTHIHIGRSAPRKRVTSELATGDSVFEAIYIYTHTHIALASFSNRPQTRWQFTAITANQRIHRRNSSLSLSLLCPSTSKIYSQCCWEVKAVAAANHRLIECSTSNADTSFFCCSADQLEIPSLLKSLFLLASGALKRLEIRGLKSGKHLYSPALSSTNCTAETAPLFNNFAEKNVCLKMNKRTTGQEAVTIATSHWQLAQCVCSDVNAVCCEFHLQQQQQWSSTVKILTCGDDHHHHHSANFWSTAAAAAAHVLFFSSLKIHRLWHW